MRRLRTHSTPLNCVEISPWAYQKIYALSHESHRPVQELVEIAINVFAHSVRDVNMMHQPKHHKTLKGTTACEKDLAIHNLKRNAAHLTRREIIEALGLNRPTKSTSPLGLSQDVKRIVDNIKVTPK